MSIISKDITKAVALLNNEAVVAIPTETVYGLAGNIYSEKAIRAIFATKQRPLFNPLIVHIPNMASLTKVARHIPEKAKLLAEAFWPGPLTLLLPKNTAIPNLITAGKDTVAVRIPNHPLALELLNKLDFPLAAPSANPFNRISPTSALHVEVYFKDQIDMVLDGGPCKSGIESTIIGFENDKPVLYRFGSIAVEDIANVVGNLIVKNSTTTKTHTEAAPEAPGMLDKHYAPITPTFLTKNIAKTIAIHKGKRIGLMAFSTFTNHKAITHQIVLSETGNLNEAASKLYAALHELDSLDLDVIIAETLPDHGLGKSINDRLRRATF